MHLSDAKKTHLKVQFLKNFALRSTKFGQFLQWTPASGGRSGAPCSPTSSAEPWEPDQGAGHLPAGSTAPWTEWRARHRTFLLTNLTDLGLRHCQGTHITVERGTYLGWWLFLIVKCFSLFCLKLNCHERNVYLKAENHENKGKYGRVHCLWGSNSVDGI